MDSRFHGSIGEYYDLFRLACPHFDELQNTVSIVIQENFMNKDLSHIDVLEVWCGTGETTLAILRWDARTKVLAIDNESTMLRQAENVLNDFVDKGRVKLVEDDALVYVKNVDSNSFDVFASCFTMHNFESKYRESLLTEIYRILKPAGLFVNADKYALDKVLEHTISLRNQLQLFQSLNSYQNRFTYINCQVLADERTEHYLQDNEPNKLMKESDSIELMKELGFGNVKKILREGMEMVLVANK